MKRYLKISTILLICILILTICNAFVACEPSSSNSGSTQNGECEHGLNHTNAVSADCTKNGNIEYWKCSKCGKYFSDANAINEIAASSITVVEKHTLSHYTANVATCTKDGNVEYWQCSKCAKTFADENATNEIDISEVAIKSTGHAVSSKWESDENGHWKVCSACHQDVDFAAHNFSNNLCLVCNAIDSSIDYNTLTPETMTEEQRQTMIMNVMTALESHINNTIGKSFGGQLKKLITIDFEGNIIKLFLNYTSFEGKDIWTLYTFTMKDNVDYESIFKNDIVPADKIGSGVPVWSILSSTEIAGETTEAVFRKINPEEDRNSFDIICLNITTSGVSRVQLNLYTLGRSGLTKTVVDTAMLNTTQQIIDRVLNGVEGIDYTIKEKEIYEFSNKSLYDFNGLWT